MLKKLPIDPYLLMLLATVALAAVLPAQGLAAEVLGYVVYFAICLLFFLYGARLSPQAMWQGLLHWRLQGLVFLATYALFPLLGLALNWTVRGIVPDALLTGMLYLCLLPSTVQSSIAFTAIAGGNVPAALTSASLSNLLGVFVTPLLVALLLSADGAHFDPAEALGDIATQLLLPFFLGQLARPFIAGWLARHKPLTQVTDRGSVLLVVYAAFSEGMVAGIWSQVSPGDLGIVLALNAALLALALGITALAGRLLGFDRPDRIAILFCGSKKSMATGIPMANILFAGGAISLIVLPLMLFHQLQLFACAYLAQRFARRTAAEAAAVADPAASPA